MNAANPVAVIADASGNLATVKPASQSAVAADASLVVALSPNSPMPNPSDMYLGIGSINAADTASTYITGYQNQLLYSGTPTTGSVATATLPSEALVHFEISGTFVGTIQVEFMVNSFWVKQNCKVSTLPLFSSSFTSPVVALAMVAGKSYLRFRATAWTSGTATVSAKASTNPGITYVSNALQLVDSLGNQLSGLPGATVPSALGVQGVAGGVAQSVSDIYQNGQTLGDQVGANNVLTFAFGNVMDLVWICSQGDTSRADPFGGTPSASQGIPCFDSAPQPITFATNQVKVYAPATATKVSAWGFRY